MQHKETQINGQRIAYYESPGKGPAVVMIHGNSMSGLSFLKQLESPLGEKYRLIAIDLPGHGRSDNAAEPEITYTLPGYAEILVSFIEQLDLKRAVFAGWSLGGHVILEAADRLPATGLMIFGTPPVSSMAQFLEACFPVPELPCVYKPDLTEAEATTWSARFFSPGTKDIPEFIISDIMRTDGKARECLGASAAKGECKDEIGVLTGLSIPMAVIHGGKEQVINYAYLKRLAIPTLWRGEIQVIPDAGHTPQWEQPEGFNALLEKFIEDCSSI